MQYAYMQRIPRTYYHLQAVPDESNLDNIKLKQDSQEDPHEDPQEDSHEDPQKYADEMEEQIIHYIKNDLCVLCGKDANTQLFYTYINWPTFEIDMCVLSLKFPKYKFYVYSKNELYMLQAYHYTFVAGHLTYKSTNPEINVYVRDECGLSVNINSLDDLDHSLLRDSVSYPNCSNPNNYDQLQPVQRKTCPGKKGDRGIGDNLHVLTDISIMVGQTAAGIGSLSTELLVASRILSVGLAIVDQMQDNLIKYGINKGKCVHLANRCNNIVNIIAAVPPKYLNTQIVLDVVHKLEASRILIKDYIKQWKITKFFSSSYNHRKFSDMNSDLGDVFYDFQVYYLTHTQHLQE